MNCLTARQTLELYRPDESETAERDAAVRHLEDCSTCRDAVRHQAALDLRIGPLCRDVPVPADLKGRLLERLMIGTDAVQETPVALPGTGTQLASAPVTRPVAPTTTRWGRRRVLSIALGSAALLAAGLSVWFVVRPTRPSVNVAEIVQAVLAGNVTPEQFPDFTKFVDSAPLQLPATMDSRGLSRVLLRQVADYDAAVYFFSVGGLDGRLIVIPRRSVKDGLPGATKFREQTAYILPFCTTAWVEGDFVYVCCLRGGENEFRRLQPAGKSSA